MKKAYKEFYNIQEINNLIESNPLKIVLDAESNYRGQLFRLAKKIKGSKCKIILLSGPSCAGKTTTAKLLKEILEKYNKHIITISMDDFFLDREKTPKLPDGSYDFDSLGAVNIAQMEKSFTDLFEKGKAKFPRFDFLDGLNYENVFDFELKKNTMILFEGIHVLNPEITTKLGTDKFFKVYASPETGFEGNELKLTSENLRLVRRMIRDVERRGHTPEHTLGMWKNVRNAEETYIYPHKNDANFIVNTTHSYELAIHKKELYALLFNHNDVIRELEFIGVFDLIRNVNKKYLPETSLMWEFIDKEN